MFATVHIIKSWAWLAIQQDLSATEHNSIGDALQVNPWLIILEATGLESNYKYTNKGYAVEIYDSQGHKKDSIGMGKWLLTNLTISYSGYDPIIVKFSVTDPLGYTEAREFGKYREGLRNALAFLQAASQFPSWADWKQNDPNEAYNIKMTELQALQLENKRLQSDLAKSSSEVEVLKLEIERLQAQIETVKSAVLPQHEETPEKQG